eukprot:CAMPEP_0176497222 /NCGR_PEP_ID=MMETSP0200_2-20121128/11605_1 /TAXON_ID=947934 /ORGANISM="Chaetoceros sp., Strain GSL56" /LENGTH=53 /DNA_ID=CAMNT_0017895213 /DNA_START=111 /DNA_END=268 /DNA_ORIENTATION=-
MAFSVPKYTKSHEPSSRATTGTSARRNILNTMASIVLLPTVGSVLVLHPETSV